MSWIATGVTVGMSVLQAGSAYSEASANTKFQKKQTEYNNMMVAWSARRQGIALDTNAVRVKMESATALQNLSHTAAEAKALAQVNAAALNVGAGTYSTVLNSFARKENQAGANIMQSLVSELVTNKLQRVEVAMNAMAGTSTQQFKSPSALSYGLGAAGNIFTKTYGLWGGSGGNSANPLAGNTSASRTSVGQIQGAFSI